MTPWIGSNLHESVDFLEVYSINIGIKTYRNQLTFRITFFLPISPRKMVGKKYEMCPRIPSCRRNLLLSTL